MIAAKQTADYIDAHHDEACTGLRRIYRRKPLFSIHIEKPIYPKGNTMYEKSQYLYIESLKAMDKIVEQSYTADNLIREERPV